MLYFLDTRLYYVKKNRLTALDSILDDHLAQPDYLSSNEVCYPFAQNMIPKSILPMHGLDSVRVSPIGRTASGKSKAIFTLSVQPVAVE